MYACYDNSFNCVQILLEAKVDLNVVDNVTL